MNELHDSTEFLLHEGLAQDHELPEPLDPWSVDDFSDIIHAGRVVS
jgi:hypothetical protein